ncbi:hypothetical protein CPC08DRAFT_765800 [Agrocybe pediades]|nr:hypothetical protein CPC08DRAFT_765800 [Agrocybe pediades]
MALMVPSSRFSLGNDSLCAFDVPSEKHGEFHFNLCPLWSAREKEKKVITVIIDEDTPPTHTQYVYKIARIGATFWDTTLPAELQCPEGSWVCLTVINTRPDHPSEPQRILQVVPVANFAESKPIGALQVGADNRHDIKVALHGGKYQAKKHKALFKFKCDPKSNENTEPEYLWNFNGTHAFSWKSKYACPSMQATPVPPTKTPPGAPGRPTPKPTPGDRDSEPPDKPPTEGEEDWEPVTTPGPGRLHGSRLNVLGVLVPGTPSTVQIDIIIDIF